MTAINVISDHSELTSVGNLTHTQIDTYLTGAAFIVISGSINRPTTSRQLSCSSGITITDSGPGSNLLIKSTLPITGSTFDYIDLKTNFSATYKEGRIFYDNDNKCLAVLNDVSDVTLQVGQETYIRVVNKTGVNIANGACVYIDGAQGNRPTVRLAHAGEHLATRVIGLATHIIEPNTEGLITVNGTVSGYDTRPFNPGDMLWVSGITSGSLTNIKPIGYNHVKLVGYAINSTVDGKVLVYIEGASELNDLCDIYEATPTTGNHLIASGGYWTSSNFSNDVMSNIGSVINDPTGFHPCGVEHATTLSSSNNNRTFTITPTSTTFDVWVKGVNYIKTGSQSVIWPNVEGAHFFYFDTTGSLKTTNTGTMVENVIAGDGAIVASIYWDTTGSIATLYEERHGIQMDGKTHLYLHNTQGAKYISGGALGNLVVDAGGNLATHAQFSVSDVVIYDEDIKLSSLDATQILTTPAQIPIYYLSGSTQNWRLKPKDNYPVIWSDGITFTGAAGRLAYNQFTGGSWRLTEAPNTNHVLMHYYATCGYFNRVIGILGQATYTTVANARAGASTEISSLVGTLRLLSKEAVPLATVIYQTANTYTNQPKARIVSSTGGSYVNWTTTNLPVGVTPTVHGNLSSLTSDDHQQYALLAGRSGGQTLNGGSDSGDNLTLQSTSNITKGLIILNDSTSLNNNTLSNASIINGIPYITTFSQLSALSNVKTNSYIMLSGSIIANASLELPSNISVKFIPGSSLYVSSSYRVHFNGNIEAGDDQIFYGLGFTSIAQTPIKPSWWGGVTDPVDWEVVFDKPGIYSGSYYSTNGTPVICYRTGSTTYLNNDTFLTASANSLRVTSNGILVEPASSQTLSTINLSSAATWVPTGITSTTGDQASPGGLSGSYLITENTANSEHKFVYSSAITGDHTFSIYVKYVSIRYFALTTNNGARSCLFDLVNKTFTATSCTGELVDVGNGWFRVSINGTTASENITITLYDPTGVTSTYTGTSKQILLYHPQLEASKYMTSHMSVGDSRNSETIYINIPPLRDQMVIDVDIMNDRYTFASNTVTDTSRSICSFGLYNTTASWCPQLTSNKVEMSVWDSNGNEKKTSNNIVNAGGALNLTFQHDDFKSSIYYEGTKQIPTYVGTGNGQLDNSSSSKLFIGCSSNDAHAGGIACIKRISIRNNSIGSHKHQINPYKHLNPFGHTGVTYNKMVNFLGEDNTQVSYDSSIISYATIACNSGSFQAQNWGIGSTGILQTIERFQRHLPNAGIVGQYSKCVVFCGNNDVIRGNSSAKTFSSLSRLYDLIRKSNLSPVPILLLPNNDPGTIDGIKTINNNIISYCTQYSLSYVNAFTLLGDNGVNSTKISTLYDYSTQSKFLNQNGQNILGAAVKNVL